MFQATEDPKAFAKLVTSDGFLVWATRDLVGRPLEVIGTIAVFLALVGTDGEKLAFWGMILAVVSDVFGGAFFAFATFVFPQVGELILAGNESVAPIGSLSSFMPVMLVGAVATTVGLVMHAVAIWRTDVFPKWSGLLVVIGWLAVMFGPGYFLQIAANAVWGSAYLWMAFSSWRRFSELEPA